MTHKKMQNNLISLYKMRLNCPQARVKRDNLALELNIEVHISCENIPLLMWMNC